MAKINIDLNRVIDKVHPHIYGQFIEHMGRAIYGGIYEPSSKLADKEGFRIDVLEKIKELQVPILRWPGGNFASGYHWVDGIGPKETRPQKKELAWDTVESNQFGTHEFMELVRRIGAAPYICVNLGLGTPEEAAAWVEYCNSTADTYWANLRCKNGAKEPFKVRYWGLGNEIYGKWQLGHKNAQDYAKVAFEAAKMMKCVDPEIKIIACGANDPDWDCVVLESLWYYGIYHQDILDYISIHRYDGDDTYYGLLAAPLAMERDLKALEGIIMSLQKKFNSSQRPSIAFDEWNVWYRKLGNRQQASKCFREGEDLLEEFYNLRDALYVGCVLNLFQRHAHWVKMANMAQLVNVIAPIFATPKGSYYQPIYWPMKLYRQLHHNIALDVRCESETYNVTDAPEIIDPIEEFRADRSIYKEECNIPYLDVSATCSEDKKSVTISVVNRHHAEAIDAMIDLGDYQPTEGKSYTINGEDPMGYALLPNGKSISDNKYNPEACKVTETLLSKVSSKITYSFPAHSITLLELRV
ncbi:alpha-N-arabinofuranosidase [Candidatus Calescamantes bacterium]|nr:alpha-N-arabinofuranosidase [Candidatus Calescamantes bacterium]